MVKANLLLVAFMKLKKTNDSHKIPVAIIHFSNVSELNLNQKIPPLRAFETSITPSNQRGNECS